MMEQTNDKAELGGLIRRMKEDGAPDSAIKLAVEKYKSKQSDGSGGASENFTKGSQEPQGKSESETPFTSQVDVSSYSGATFGDKAADYSQRLAVEAGVEKLPSEQKPEMFKVAEKEAAAQDMYNRVKASTPEERANIIDSLSTIQSDLTRSISNAKRGNNRSELPELNRRKAEVESELAAVKIATSENPLSEYSSLLESTQRLTPFHRQLVQEDIDRLNNSAKELADNIKSDSYEAISEEAKKLSSQAQGGNVYNDKLETTLYELAVKKKRESEFEKKILESKAVKEILGEYKDPKELVSDFMNLNSEVTAKLDSIYNENKRVVDEGYTTYTLNLERTREEIESQIASQTLTQEQGNSKLQLENKRLYENYLREITPISTRLQSEAARQEALLKEKYSKVKNLPKVFDDAARNIMIEENAVLYFKDMMNGRGKTFLNTYASGIGRSVSAIAALNGNVELMAWGDAVADKYKTANLPMKEWGDLFDVDKMLRSTANLGASATSSILAGAAASYLTAGLGTVPAMAAAALATFASETMDIAGQMKRDVMQETGDAVKANEAAKESVNAQMSNWWLYSASGLPFVGKALNKIPRALRIPVGGTVEVVEETAQESVQGAQEQSIKQFGTYERASDFYTPEYFKETFLNVAPTFLLGGGSKVKGVYTEYKESSLGKELGAMLAMSDINSGGLQQLLTNAYVERGEVFTKGVVSGYISSGILNESQGEQVLSFLETLKSDDVDSRAFGLNDEKSFVYMGILNKYREAKSKAENVSPDSPIRERYLEEAKAIKTNLDNILNGEGEYAVVEVMGNKFVLTQQETAEFIANSPEGYTVNAVGFDVTGMKPKEQTIDTKAEEVPKVGQEGVKTGAITDINQQMILESVEELGDTESKTFTFETLESIPEPLRERAVERMVESEETLYGKGLKGMFNQLLGKGETKKVKRGSGLFEVTVTGKELRNIANKESSQVNETENLTNEQEVESPSIGVTGEATQADALKDVESTAKALEGVDKKKLTPMKMVGQLTKDLPNKGDRKRLKTPMGDVGDNYNVGNVEVTLSEDFDFGELNGEEQQADVSINFIGVTKKDSLGKGLASKELDRIIALADTRGMSLSLVVDPQGATFGVEGLDKVGLLNSEQLKEWYVRKGFLFDEDSSYGFRPAKNKKQLSEAYHKAKADGSNPELVKAVEELLSSKQEQSGVQESVSKETVVTTEQKQEVSKEKALKALDELREKLKKANKPLGDTGAKTMGVDSDALIDFVFDAAKALVEAGYTVANAVKEAVETAKSIVDFDEADVSKKVSNRLKPKSVSVESETKGLTPKEVARQGVIEIVDAYKAKVREAKEAMKAAVKAAKDDAKLKQQAIDDVRIKLSEAIKEIEGIQKDLGLKKQVPTILARYAAGVKTEKQAEFVIDKLIEHVELQELKALKSKVAKEVGNINENKFINFPIIDLFKTIDLNLLSKDELNEMLRIAEDINEKPVSQIKIDEVADAITKFKQKTEKSRVVTDESAEKRIESIINSDKSAYNKIRDFRNLIRNILASDEIKNSDALLKDIADYMDTLAEEMKEETAYVNRMNKSVMDPILSYPVLESLGFNREERRLIMSLRGIELLDNYVDALKLNSLLEAVSNGFVDLKVLSDYRRKVIANNAVNVADSLSKRKPEGYLSKFMSILGLRREGFFSDRDRYFDAEMALATNSISLWSELFGEGKNDAISTFFNMYFTAPIINAAREIKALQSQYNEIVYPFFSKQMSELEKTRVALYRQQGAYEIATGEKKDMYTAMTKIDGYEKSKTDAERTVLQKAWESMPRKDGVIDIVAFRDSMNSREKKLNDYLTKLAIAQDMQNRVSAGLDGRPYESLNPNYYLTHIIEDRGAVDLDGDINEFVKELTNFKVTGTRSSNIFNRKQPLKIISFNMDRMVDSMITKAQRDYFLTDNLKTALDFTKQLKRELKEKMETADGAKLEMLKNMEALASGIPNQLKTLLEKEYISEKIGAFGKIVTRVLGAGRSAFLIKQVRMVAEVIAEVFRVTQTLNFKGVKYTIPFAANRKTMVDVMTYAGSSFTTIANIESVLPDATGTTRQRSRRSQVIEGYKDKVQSPIMGITSAFTVPMFWIPEFATKFKEITGVEFSIEKFRDSNEAYIRKHGEAIKESSAYADVQTEQMMGARTRASKATLQRHVFSSFFFRPTGSGFLAKDSKYAYLNPYTTIGMLNGFLSTFMLIEGTNFGRGLKGLVYNENTNRIKGGRMAVMGVVSMMSYQLVKDYIDYVISGDDDEEKNPLNAEKLKGTVLNTAYTLRTGKYGASARVLGGIVASLYQDNIKKRKTTKAEKEKELEDFKVELKSVGIYPISLDSYGDKARFLDQLIPYLGTAMFTGIQTAKDGMSVVEKISNGTPLNAKDDDTLAYMTMLWNAAKFAMITQGVQLPLQADLDKMVSIHKKMGDNKKLTEYDKEFIKKYPMFFPEMKKPAVQSYDDFDWGSIDWGE